MIDRKTGSCYHTSSVSSEVFWGYFHFPGWSTHCVNPEQSLSEGHGIWKQGDHESWPCHHYLSAMWLGDLLGAGLHLQTIPRVLWELELASRCEGPSGFWHVSGIDWLSLCLPRALWEFPLALGSLAETPVVSSRNWPRGRAHTLTERFYPLQIAAPFPVLTFHVTPFLSENSCAKD